jgi:hypothetical protein
LATLLAFAKRHKWWLIAAALVATPPLLLFPGRRLLIAFTLATGVGRGALQARIDELEEKAIRRAPPSDEDKAFLIDFYRTLATGGRLSIFALQTGRMMDHYLDGSGAPYRLKPEIFRQNRKVQAQLRALRARAGLDCRTNVRLSSPKFYMPDASKLDSVFGLYHGTLHLTQTALPGQGCQRELRAEVPWVWPAYAELRRKYGTPHAESFPLPSLRSLFLGPKHALFVENGLGEYLEQIGLAKSFLAFSEWREVD